MAELSKQNTSPEPVSSSPSQNAAQNNAAQSNPAYNHAVQSNPARNHAAQTALNEGIKLYDEGNFNGAIKRLSKAPEIWSADKVVQISALKYMAFSYCVTSRPTLCKRQFQKALKLDPAFDLAPGEKGHPRWSPVFDRAKKESSHRVHSVRRNA
jgi:tetratricopeptide (TPR) repeat protein